MVNCSTPNIYCVPSTITTTNSGDKTVVFTSSDFQVRGEAPYDGTCEVCHTGTSFHRNNSSGDHTHFADQKCTDCHLHGPMVMISRNLCYTCHGGNSGDAPEGNVPMFVSPELGPSHVTHTEINAKGPDPLECDTCHIGGTYDVDEMVNLGACDACHSPGGDYNGVQMGKNNWDAGVYEVDGISLKSGKEQWCNTCHDSGTSTCDGAGAPDIGLYYTGGHGRNGNVECLDCHDATITHIDGEPRTYAFNSAYYSPAQSGVAYASGYRLQDINGEVPLMIPTSYNITFGYDAGLMRDNAFRLCFNCHDSSKILDNTPGDGIDSNFKASLPNPPRDYSYAWGSGADTNEHTSHIMNYIMTAWDSDWETGTTGAGGSNGCDSLHACSSCHNVHGAAGSFGSSNEAMIRDGSLAERPGGYGFSYVIEDIGSGGYPIVTSTGATRANSIGSIFRNNTEINNMCAGSMCHGNPAPPAESSYDAGGSSWGTYLEYYRPWNDHGHLLP